MRFLVFAGSFDAHRAGDNTFLGESEDLTRARRVADTHGCADWYLIYDRTSRKLTCVHRRERFESTHAFNRSLVGI